MAWTGLLAAVATPAGAEIEIDGGLLDTGYRESFDGLPAEDFTWSNDGSVPGWYGAPGSGGLDTGARENDGSSNARDLVIHSLGVAGDAERALTYHTREAATPTYLGAAFANGTGSEIAGFTVGYTAEQWNEGTDNRTLRYDVEYRIGAGEDDLAAGDGWTPIDGLSIDTQGGATGESTGLSGGLVVDPIPAGASLWIRWKLSNDAESATASNDTLGIDDVTIDFEAPEDLAPAIVEGPLPQMVAVGDTASFQVTASGVPAPDLQWFHDGEPIPGASDASLLLEDVQLAQAGDYTVLASNSQGQATSGPAVLTVSTTPLPPQILVQPQDAAGVLGGSAALEVVATGSGTLSYEWFRNGSPLGSAGADVLALDPLQGSDAGSYTVAVSNVAGSATSDSATVHVVIPPTFVVQPEGVSVAVGGTATLTAEATGEGEIAYQWFKDGDTLTGETSDLLRLEGVVDQDEALYHAEATNAAGTTASEPARVNVLEVPVIVDPPGGAHLVVGGGHTFAVAVAGSPPFEYQWLRDGAELPGETTERLVLSSVVSGDAGDYSVRVSNAVGSVTSGTARLDVSEVAVAPVIAGQPVGFGAAADTIASLSVTATGTEPLSYQWTHDGTPVAGDGPVLEFSPLAPGDAGSYRVTVSNAAGSDTSAIAVVEVAASTQRDYYVSPDGLAEAAGTLQDPTTLPSAITRVQPGFRIYLRGGTYEFDEQLTIERDNAGLGEGQRKGIFAYTPPGGEAEEPVLDFSSQPYGKTSQVSNPRGIKIDGHWWHLRGLRIFRAADNGIFVGGNHNIIERCVTHGNRDTGVQISRYSSEADDKAEWPAHNLVLNCDSYDNHDHEPNQGENADGFAAKLTSGPGNVFRGCVGHNNIDDGWDLFTKSDTGTIFPVVIDRCIAYGNGTLTDGTQNDSGDRNGFKLGGSKIGVVHYVTRSIAFDNGKNGFTWNSNPASMLIANNLAFDNERGNFKFDDPAPVFVNNVSLYTAGKGQSDRYGGNSGIETGPSNLFWFTGSSSRGPSINDQGLEISAAGFRSLTAPPGGFERDADGGLQLGDFARPVEGSPLIDAGVLPPEETWDELVYDVGTYHENEPDIGVVETYLVTLPDDDLELLGYALGYRDPAETRIDLPVLEPDGDQSRFGFHRLRADVDYLVEVSDDLRVWQELALNPGEVGRRVEVLLPRQQGVPCRFLRLQVTTKP